MIGILVVIGVGLVVIGVGIGIGNVGFKVMEVIVCQLDVVGDICFNMILMVVFVEGVVLIVIIFFFLQDKNDLLKGI